MRFKLIYNIESLYIYISDTNAAIPFTFLILSTSLAEFNNYSTISRPLLNILCYSNTCIFDKQTKQGFRNINSNSFAAKNDRPTFRHPWRSVFDQKTKIFLRNGKSCSEPDMWTMVNAKALFEDIRRKLFHIFPRFGLLSTGVFRLYFGVNYWRYASSIVRKNKKYSVTQNGIF